METAESIIIGAFSGVITAGFLFILGKAWINIIIPWYQKITYQGVDVSGKWVFESKPDAEKPASFILTLTQNAHGLSGHALISKPDESKLLFKAHGTVWEGYISLTMKTTDRKRLSFANILLKVCAGGKELKGSIVYRHMKTDIVDTGKLVLTRE